MLYQTTQTDAGIEIHQPPKPVVPGELPIVITGNINQRAFAIAPTDITRLGQIIVSSITSVLLPMTFQIYRIDETAPGSRVRVANFVLGMNARRAVLVPGVDINLAMPIKAGEIFEVIIPPLSPLAPEQPMMVRIEPLTT